MGRFAVRLVILINLLAAAMAHAQARFDLEGPRIDVHVTRAGVSLPIAAVPNLQPGDTLWLHPDLPPTQSVHYLLIAVFLRGNTNPPPDPWFTRIETWKKEVREEGVSVTVPAEAQQAILFLAPETGGDFSTLRSAVQGRPGVFVRASQDLTEAGFEQARIDAYLLAMKRVPPSDPAALLEHSNLLARTLNLKPNADCFKRPLDQQYNCLTQTGSQTLLDDGHGQSLLTALSTGSGSDFINAASATRLAAGGNYSAYVGALVDFARIVNSIHTAQYQYIPALATPDNESLNLRLNTPPSFHNPKSVIVIGLPAIHAAVPPPLRPADPDHISCLLDPHLVLPVQGAPLVFSTAFAHDLVLHLNTQPLSPTSGSAAPQANNLSLIPDAFQGGFVLAPAPSPRRELPIDPVSDPRAALPTPAAALPTPAAALPTPSAALPTPAKPGETLTGTLHGFWGFDRFTGPTLDLQQTAGEGWHIVGAPDTTLIAGQPNHLQLLSSGTACIQSIQLEPGDAKVDWKLGKPGEPAPSGPAPSGPAPSEPAPSEVVAAGPVTAGSTAADSVQSPTQAPHAGSGPSSPSGTPNARQFDARSAHTKPDSSLSPDVTSTSFHTVSTAPRPVDLTLNLQHAATPGSIRLAILQFGSKVPDQLGTRTFSQPAKILSLALHAGDETATLTGDSLQQVKSLHLADFTYIPANAPPSPESRTGHQRDLTLPAGTRVPFKPGEHLSGEIYLEDGRTLEVSTTVAPPRPAVSLLSRRIVAPSPSPILLASPNDLPLGDQLLFFLKSRTPFARTEKIEIAQTPLAEPTSQPDPGTDPGNAPEELLHTTLSLESGLILQDAHTVLATFDPLKIFGPSTFGAFRLRAIAPDGTPGEWLPLTTIVRLPQLTALTCPALPRLAAATPPRSSAGPAPHPAPAQAQPADPPPPPDQAGQTTCTLSGSGLYLVQAFSLDSAFTKPIPVPDAFVDPTLPLPRPASPSLFLRLRDDPTTVQTVTLPIQTAPPPAPAPAKATP